MLKAYADHWGLITGASSGIGAEFARQLAARGMHCVLVARREDRLRELAQKLEAAHGIRCEIVPADLSQPRAGRELLAEIARRGIEVELLVNNAGFGMVSSLDQTDVGRALELIQVNVTCLTELTLLAAKEMVHRGHGGIINIGSVVSFQPVAYMGVYAASKAYVLHFSEALWAELQAHGVTLTTKQFHQGRAAVDGKLQLVHLRAIGVNFGGIPHRSTAVYHQLTTKVGLLLITLHKQLVRARKELPIDVTG